jgi:hypothetical protein
MTKQRISNVIAWTAFAYACLMLGNILLELLIFALEIFLGRVVDVGFMRLWFCYPILLITNYVLVGSYRVIPWK